MSAIPESPYAGKLKVYGGREDVARAAAELFVSCALESSRARSRFRVALSGGSTPRALYELLASDAFRDRIDWKSVEIFWGDERYVPADDRDSNYRMTSEALLRHVPLPQENVHRIPTEISPPSAAAEAYENAIRQSFAEPASVPRFDLIYLGLGSNGHTASLFPRSRALRERSRLVLADQVEEVDMWRITMTAPLLNRGRTLAFLVTGEEKAQVLRDVLFSARDPERLPAQLIQPEDGELLWLADRASAAGMPGPDLAQRSA